jgi:hypothetical protein
MSVDVYAIRVGSVRQSGDNVVERGAFPMKLKIGAAGVLIPLLWGCTPSAIAQAPSITNVTNAAIPFLDQLPGYTGLAPGTLATIFGSNLADKAVSTPPPWTSVLGGVQVHLIIGIFTPCATANPPTTLACEIPVDLLYVSPTQINFLVPDVSVAAYGGGGGFKVGIVLIRDGQRFGTFGCVDPLCLNGPGIFGIGGGGENTINDAYIFIGGYDCLFSLSLTSPPSACGLSPSPIGTSIYPIGAVTDLSGNLITNQNPVHQGQPVTMWMTGLTGLSQSPATGLLQQPSPGPFFFDLSQYGVEIIPEAFLVATPVWAGQSPQYVGLDQVNVNFPTCTNQVTIAERRYDAYLAYNVDTVEPSYAAIYIPFLVKVGDPDCFSTPSTLTSSFDPSAPGQSVTFTFTVSPSTATGAVIFFDGTATLGNSTLSGGQATLSTSNLSVGSHSITAVYSGDSVYPGSSRTLTQLVNTLSTTVTLTSGPNPSMFGQTVTFAATVSPPTATGTITFSEPTCSPAPCSASFVALGTGTLSGGKAALSTSSLSGGTHLIAAIYSGDTYYSGGTSSNLTQSVKKDPTTVTLSSSPNPSISGQTVTFTAVVSPSSATGVVTVSGCTGTLSGGQAQCSAIPAGPPGVQSITATYGGDSNYNGSTSAALMQTVKQNTATTLTSSANPSTLGQSVTFTALMYFSNATGTITFVDGTTTLGSSPVTKAVATFSTSTLAVGTHSITAVYSGDGNFGGSTSAVLVQTVR